MEDNKKYSIEGLNRKQIRLISDALEMYARINCGQLEISMMPPIRDALWRLYDSDDPSEYRRKSDAAKAHLNELKRIIWDLEPNESYGIGNFHDSDLGYEMYKQILHHFEKESMEEEGDNYRWCVHSSKPLKLTEEPTIKVSNT